MEEGNRPDPKQYFQKLYCEFGNDDERSLGWSKHKQKYRFAQVSKYITNGNSVLDIGCGFADLFQYFQDSNLKVNYYGIDVMEDFIDRAKNKYKNEASFYCGKLETQPWDMKWDWIVECGLFGLQQYDEDKMYDYIEETIRVALELASIGISFNFLSDKVDYRTSGNDFHANPERILGIAYKYSRRVALDNSVLPFEYCLTIWKNDSFSVETTVFDEVYNK